MPVSSSTTPGAAANAQTLSFEQLEALWVAAGGPATVAPTMAAIALAESSGKPNATNQNTNGTTDRGLWQINDVWGSLSTYSIVGNAMAAVHVYKTQGLGAWATYNSGHYKNYLKDASVPDFNKTFDKGWQKWLLNYYNTGGPAAHPGSENASLVGTVLDGPAAIAKPVTDVIDSVGKFLSFITSVRFFKILLGFASLILGAVFIGREYAIPAISKAVR